MIPVVALRNAGSIDLIDKTSQGIMTANFDELSDFFAKSYEWILENIWIIGILNNLFIREDINIFPNRKTYQEFNKSAKGSRLNNNYIDVNELFSKPLGSLNNKVRNAIQHFDAEIDYISQEITFTNTNKGNKVTINNSLIDFTKLCIENFCLMVYLLELVYNLRKLDYTINKNISTIPNLTLENFHIKTTHASRTKKKIKIGRNAPCPCGSNKKYKKCCLLKEIHN